ncbi:MAG TPA: 4'-phosphopantetheinyl transferase superfamily protein [Rhizomicrobium sp.]
MIRRASELEALFDADVRVMREVGSGDTHGLHPAEAKVVARAVAVRRAEFAAGRACAHAALDALGAPDIPLLPGPDRAPVWPEGFVGSICHTRGACAAVAASRGDTAGLGLDVEPPRVLARDLYPLICRPEERLHHVRLPTTGADWAMLTFCAKEAFYKAYRPLTGRFLDFHDVSVRFTLAPSPNAGTFQAVLTDRGLPLCGQTEALTGRWRHEPDHLWAAFTWPAQEA